MIPILLALTAVAAAFLYAESCAEDLLHARRALVVARSSIESLEEEVAVLQACLVAPEVWPGDSPECDHRNAWRVRPSDTGAEFVCLDCGHASPVEVVS